MIEHVRAEEGSRSIMLSPGKVKAALELQDRRNQEKEQGREKKTAESPGEGFCKGQEGAGSSEEA
jgi:hypothetical protein